MKKTKKRRPGERVRVYIAQAPNGERTEHGRFSLACRRLRILPSQALISRIMSGAYLVTLSPLEIER